MNQKRSWPGVPNRYSTRWVPMVSRPKSIATVVVVLLPTPVRSSGPTLPRVRAPADRADERGLARPEAARDENLERGEGDAGAIRGRGAHSGPPSAWQCWAPRPRAARQVR